MWNGNRKDLNAENQHLEFQIRTGETRIQNFILPYNSLGDCGQVILSCTEFFRGKTEDERPHVPLSLHWRNDGIKMDRVELTPPPPRSNVAKADSDCQFLQDQKQIFPKRQLTHTSKYLYKEQGTVHRQNECICSRERVRRN